MTGGQRLVATAAAAGALLAIVACNTDAKGLGDAPIGRKIEDERLVIVNGDDFPNLMVICDGTTAIYTHTREAAPFTVPNSTLCDGRGIDANGVEEGDLTEGEDLAEEEE